MLLLAIMAACIKRIRTELWEAGVKRQLDASLRLRSLEDRWPGKGRGARRISRFLVQGVLWGATTRRTFRIPRADETGEVPGQDMAPPPWYTHTGGRAREMLWRLE